MNDVSRQELINECLRQEENCAYTATSFVIWLRTLEIIRVVCTVAPVIFGALATWKMVAQNSPISGAVFTLLATVIPPAYTASRAGAAISQFREMAGEFTNLRDRFRQGALIEAHKTPAQFEQFVKVQFDRLEKARNRMLVPPEWCFKRAQKKHKAGHYQHDLDEKKNIGQA